MKQRLLSTSNANYSGLPMTPTHITVHETANTSKGANAEMHARYLENGAGGRTVSWHYTVDDIETIQHLLTNIVGWHCGDGYNGKGNRHSIGIEICVNEDGDFEQAKRNAQELIRHLMNEHNIPLSNVVPHKHWSGKDCPRNLLDGWSAFKDDLKDVSSQDDTKGHWAEKSIQKAKQNGIINGYSDGSFRPNETVTRAELSVILDRLGLLKEDK